LICDWLVASVAEFVVVAHKVSAARPGAADRVQPILLLTGPPYPRGPRRRGTRRCAARLGAGDARAALLRSPGPDDDRLAR